MNSRQVKFKKTGWPTFGQQHDLPIFSFHCRRVIKSADIVVVTGINPGSGCHQQFRFLFILSGSFALFPLFFALFIFTQFLGFGG